PCRCRRPKDEECDQHQRKPGSFRLGKRRMHSQKQVYLLPHHYSRILAVPSRYPFATFESCHLDLQNPNAGRQRQTPWLETRPARAPIATICRQKQSTWEGSQV